MNNAKIAAALHALADAFLTPSEQPEEQPAATGKATRGKAKAAAVDASPAAAATAPAENPASTPAATASVAAAAAPAEPPAPSVTLKEVNALVIKAAAKDRDGAVAILRKFGLTNTVGLAQDKWQAVYDAFEEEIARQDAAAVQVAQASLV